MIVGEMAPHRTARHHRDVVLLHRRQERRPRLAMEHAVAGDEQRPLGLGDEVHHLREVGG